MALVLCLRLGNLGLKDPLKLVDPGIMVERLDAYHRKSLYQVMLLLGFLKEEFLY